MKKKIVSVILVFACVLSCFRPLTLVAEDNKGADETRNVGLKDVVLWGMPGTEKVYKDIGYDSDYYSSYKTDARIDLVMAKGEYEGGQIIISANSDVTFDASSSELTSGENSIAADDVEIFVQKYINVSANYDSNSNLPVAKYPDALVPMANLKAVGENVVKSGENQGLYVRVKTSVDQAPGEYTGSLTLHVGEENTQIPVRVQVADVTVSQEVHNKNVFTNAWYFYEGELDSTQEMLDKYNEALLDYRIGMGTMLMYGAHHHEDISTPEQREAWVAKAYGYMQDPACSTIRLPYTTDTAQMTAVMQAIADYSAEKEYDMFAKLVVYPGGLIDEPRGNGTMADAERICRSFDSLKHTFADTLSGDGLQARMADSVRKIPMIVTEYYDGALDNAGATFCPQFQHYDTANLRTQYEGQERWWYGCIYPRAPFPTYHTDDTWLSARLIGWMQAQYNVVGNLFWATDVYAAYSDNGYQSIEEYYEGEAARYPAANGDGYLFYPGKKYGIDGPIGSMRLEAIRDGYEEYEILYAVKQRYLEGDNSLSSYAPDFEQFVGSLTEAMYTGTTVAATTEEFRAARLALLKAAARNKEMGVAALDDSDNGYGEKNSDWKAQESDTEITHEATQDNPGQSFASVSKSVSAVKANTQSEVLLADFEEWVPDFQTLRIRNEFGSIDVNTDADYVKSGRQSAALTVVGSKDSTNPLFFVNTVSTQFGYDYSDFSCIDSVSAWFYNASDTEEQLHVGLITGIVSIEQVDLQKYDTFTLRPGWNEVVYEPDMNYIISLVGKDSYQGIRGVYFMFENPHAATKAGGKRFYVDDVKLHYGEENTFTEVHTGSFYGSGTKIGTSGWIVLDNPVKMKELEGKALHFEFKFDSDTGRFGFALMDGNPAGWKNVTGTLIIEKTTNGVFANMGRIVELEDGWYAWELNRDMFEGDGADTAEDVSLIYHQNEVVQGNVIIDWKSMRVADTGKYTDGDLINKDFSKDVPMADLAGKALQFEFKFTTDTGKFGFALMDGNPAGWKNVTGTLVIEKKDGNITSNIGRIVETGDGWYAWQFNRELFAGDGVSEAREVGLACDNNRVGGIDTTVQGTVYIDWESMHAADIRKYTDGNLIYNDFSKDVPMSDLKGKALEFEFKFTTETGKFGFALMDNKWKNITGTIVIEKKDGRITSNIGRIVEKGDDWYVWRLSRDLFQGDGVEKAKEVGLAYHNKEMGDDVTVQGTVYINWESMRAADIRKYADGNLIYNDFSKDVPMSDLEGKALQFEFKFVSETGRFGFALTSNDWENVTGTLVIEKKASGQLVSNIGRIVETEDGWYAWQLNRDLFQGDGVEKAKEVGLANHNNGIGGIDTKVQGTVYIDWESMRTADIRKYTDGNLIYNDFSKDIPMSGLSGKALEFEFKFASEIGKFGFALMDNKWKNITGTIVIEKKDGRITSNIGRIIETEEGWYAWQLNRDLFAGDGVADAKEVGLAYHDNGTHGIDTTVQGTVYIDWESMRGVKESIVYDQTLNMKDYRGTNRRAPQKNGYVFAGWYREDTNEESGYSPLNAAEADAAESGYAKFVDEKVLRVKFQLKAYTKSNDPTAELRMLTTVDSLAYRSVGFEIGFNGKKTERNSNTVYETIKGYTNDGENLYKPSEAFKCDISKYFMSFKITGIPNQYFKENFTITPRWTTLDGTVVTGGTREITIKEGYASRYISGCMIHQEFKENVITMNELDGKALHLEFRFTTDTGKFGFDVMDTARNNITGGVRIEKRSDGTIASNIGRIVALEDGWYAWELNRDLFEGYGWKKATGVGLFYHQNETVDGEVLIDWKSMKAADAYSCEELSEKYTDDNLIYKDFSKDVPMDELSGKALQFEFKFTSETGKFGFALMSNNWKNITGTIVIEKKDGRITSNIGRIIETEEGWYAWQLNRDLFAGDRVADAKEVGLAYHDNGTHGIDTTVQGTVYIDWKSMKAADAYSREDLSEKYTEGDKIWHRCSKDVSMVDLSGKALQFEFKFTSETGKFGFAFMDNDRAWANITGTLVIEKKDGRITSNIGKIVETKDGWYAWKLNRSLFAGSDVIKAETVDLAYHNDGTGGIDTKVQGEVYIDWDSMCAVEAY